MKTHVLRSRDAFTVRRLFLELVAASPITSHVFADYREEGDEHVVEVAIHEGHACPPCSGDCDQGRRCPARHRGGNHGGNHGN